MLNKYQNFNYLFRSPYGANYFNNLPDLIAKRSAVFIVKIVSFLCVCSLFNANTPVGAISYDTYM